MKYVLEYIDFNSHWDCNVIATDARVFTSILRTFKNKYVET
jgi:hypothetical protein